jgi:predicted DNA-binding protein
MTLEGQPEAERRRKVVPLRLSPEARERLEALASGWGISRAAAAERVILSTHIISKGSK